VKDSSTKVKYKKLAEQQIDIYRDSSTASRNGIDDGVNGHSNGVNGSSTLAFGGEDNPYRVIIIGMQCI
jgi:hypothetical protein